MEYRQRYKTANRAYYDLLKMFAEKNKANQTEAEEKLWEHLAHNNMGVRFRRQHVVGTYIADFICIKSNTIIEIDGGYHSQEQQKIEDYLRTEDLERMGFHVLRFSNERVLTEISQVLDEIFDYVVKHIEINNNLIK